jgi:hypothetical protein
VGANAAITFLLMRPVVGGDDGVVEGHLKQRQDAVDAPGQVGFRRQRAQVQTFAPKAAALGPILVDDAAAGIQRLIELSGPPGVFFDGL